MDRVDSSPGRYEASESLMYNQLRITRKAGQTKANLFPKVKKSESAGDRNPYKPFSCQKSSSSVVMLGIQKPAACRPPRRLHSAWKVSSCPMGIITASSLGF